MQHGATRRSFGRLVQMESFSTLFAEKAKRWHSLAYFEVEGKWYQLVKKFCESRVRNVRRQVINFAQ
jgi:hypothetical protein